MSLLKLGLLACPPVVDVEFRLIDNAEVGVVEASNMRNLQEGEIVLGQLARDKEIDFDIGVVLSGETSSIDVEHITIVAQHKASRLEAEVKALNVLPEHTGCLLLLV